MVIWIKPLVRGTIKQLEEFAKCYLHKTYCVLYYEHNGLFISIDYVELHFNKMWNKSSAIFHGQVIEIEFYDTGR